MQALQTAKELWAQPEEMIKMWETDSHKERHEKIISDLIGKAGYIVDLGCGPGRFSECLNYEKYQGYDQSPQMIQAAKIAITYSYTEFAIIDIFQFISDYTYDTLIMVDVVQHQQSPLEAIEKILNLWKSTRYFFTLLVGNQQEELLNSVVVSRDDFLDFVNDNKLEICYTEVNSFDWVVLKKE